MPRKYFLFKQIILMNTYNRLLHIVSEIIKLDEYDFMLAILFFLYPYFYSIGIYQLKP